ncbi:hypothetical protein Curi_c17180 [Gottschalkia acidurici 9a]|uniref:Uncharacterized protein n=1 Tax=Gottschalkia acidurici (strain ATCC 7906 / DSM 604 / BCRC 14475 / CIP 104303 / KCTC 5404 / NCIMB 10678 / 9a) TaxID=1128398 RepID=K0B186_GOTA9|nr:hypothetical protein [Gottschalkia acidurici]AFS78725.1 hypothetical protein Curi_c17180 [Gottschalkia acidurici 9a]
MVTVSEDNKKLLKYLGIMFISVLITYKLPHDSYSIIEHIIMPIEYKDSVVYLSGIIPLVLLFISIKGIFNLKRAEGRNKLLLFLMIITVIMPMMKWSLDITRTGYYWIKKDSLRSVDIGDSKVSLSGSNDKLTMTLNLELIDYGMTQNNFKIRVYLPKALKTYNNQDFYELENEYLTNGNRRKRTIREEIVLNLNDKNGMEKLFDSKWHWEDLKYELYNEDEVVEIIKRGL